MTISTTTSRQSYNGNGVTTIFSVPFRFFQNADLVVQLVTNSTGASTTLVLGTHYTVSGADAEAGGSVTMVTPPAVGQTLVVRRVIAATQDVDYVAGDPFPAETHERALDRLTMLSQQGEEVNSRSLTLPAGDTTSGEIPQLFIRANKLLAFDSVGRPTVVNPSTDSATDVRMDLASTASGKGAEMVAFLQQGVVAVKRWVAEKLFESLSVLDYMTAAQRSDVLAGSALVDVTAAMNLAAQTAGTLKKALKVPSGVYKMTAPWAVPIKVRVIGESPMIQSVYDPGPAWAYGSVIFKAHGGNAIEKIGTAPHQEGAPIENITVSSHRTTYAGGAAFVLDKCSGVHLIRCNAFGIGGDAYVLGVSAGDVTGHNYVYNCYSNNPSGVHYKVRQKWGRFRDVVCDGGTWGAYLTDSPESDVTGFHFEGFTAGAIKLAGANTSTRIYNGFVGNTAGATKGIEADAVAGNQSFLFSAIKMQGSGVAGSKAIKLAANSVDSIVVGCEFNQWATGIENLAWFANTQTIIRDNEFGGCGVCIVSNAQNTIYQGNSFNDTTGAYDINHMGGSLGLWSGNTFSKGINPGVTGVAGNFSGVKVKDNAGYVTRARGVTGASPAYTNIAHGLAGVPDLPIGLSCLSSGVTSVPQIALRNSSNFQLYWTGTANVQWAWEAALPCDY